MVLDFEDYQYYNGMKLTNKINMSYKVGQNFSNIHSYELLFNKYIKDIDIVDKNILDIGACYCDTSIFLATKTKQIVYSFEPVKKTYNFLLETIELNENKNIIPFNLGISNHIGNSQIYIPTYEGYNDLTSASISNTFVKRNSFRRLPDFVVVLFCYQKRTNNFACFYKKNKLYLKMQRINLSHG